MNKNLSDGEEVIIYESPVSAGKTVIAIKLSAEKQIPLLCANEIRKSQIMDLAKRLKINIPEPITKSDIYLGDYKPLFENDSTQTYNYLLEQFVFLKKKDEKEARRFIIDSIEIENYKNNDFKKNYLNELDRINYQERQRLIYGDWEYSKHDMVFEFACILYTIVVEEIDCLKVNKEKIYQIFKRYISEFEESIKITELNKQLNSIKHSHEYKPDYIIEIGKKSDKYQNILGFIKNKISSETRTKINDLQKW